MPSRVRFAPLAAVAVTFACGGPPAQPRWPDAATPRPGPPIPERFEPPNDHDVHTHARPDEVAITHLGLSWTISFADEALRGHVTAALDRKDPEAPLRLDARGLEIERIETSGTAPGATPRLAELGDDAGWSEAKWSLGDEDPILGPALVVELPAEARLVRIHYHTGEGATGLQWLEPSQTAGESPFLYSQSQAIHARSFIPCQDSPGVRVTWDARVELDRPLVAVMAGRRVDASGKEVAPNELPADGVHRFDMRDPIPSYLIAVAAGDLEFSRIGYRTGVWAEPSMLPRAAAELQDVENMIRVAERLYGTYAWGRYDVLVLPPAFPFGGMENPRLTFATPTIIAGDRSLVSLIAHELAHSWSGNLVTNATWGDMWLNEGFTVYIERRIVEAVYGAHREEMEAVLGYQDLVEELARVDDADERLAVNLTGRDPDDGLTDVPYEKGALFLRQLELTYGRMEFDGFLQRWFSEHALTSVRTVVFEDFLRGKLVDVVTPRADASVPDIEAWIHEPGVPEAALIPHSDAFDKVDAEVARFVGGEIAAAELPGQTWTPYEWLHFLRALPEDLAVDKLADLDVTFGLTEAINYEVLAQWLEVAVRHRYSAVDERLESFLVEVGRRKFLTPLYEALLAVGRKADAERIYARARDGYHAVSRRTIESLLAGA